MAIFNPLKSTLQIAWSYGYKALAKKRYGRNFALTDFHHLKIIKAGHWEYMGHTITREIIESVDYVNVNAFCSNCTVWVIRRKSDGTKYKTDNEYLEGFSTKDGARWRLYNEYITLARSIVDIEEGR